MTELGDKLVLALFGVLLGVAVGVLKLLKRGRAAETAGAAASK